MNVMLMQLLQSASSSTKPGGVTTSEEGQGFSGLFSEVRAAFLGDAELDEEAVLAALVEELSEAGVESPEEAVDLLTSELAVQDEDVDEEVIVSDEETPVDSTGVSPTLAALIGGSTAQDEAVSTTTDVDAPLGQSIKAAVAIARDGHPADAGPQGQVIKAAVNAVLESKGSEDAAPDALQGFTPVEDDDAETAALLARLSGKAKQVAVSSDDGVDSVAFSKAPTAGQAASQEVKQGNRVVEAMQETQYAEAAGKAVTALFDEGVDVETEVLTTPLAKSSVSKDPGVAAMLPGVQSDALVKARPEVEGALPKVDAPVTGVERSTTLAVQSGVSDGDTATEPLRMPERVTVEQVPSSTIKAVRYLITKGDGTITVKLVPESLGSMQIQVQQIDGEVQVRLMSASTVVRDVLEQGVPQLRESLQQLGLDLGSVDVDNHSDQLWQQASQSRGEAAGQGSDENGFASELESSLAGEGTSSGDGPSSTSTAHHDGALDLLI